MKANMGITDKAIRIIISIVMGALIFAGVVTGTFALVTGIVGGVFVLTSIFGFCPLYRLLGVSTCKRV